ncbi:MAG: ATP-binding protein [Vicinamibacterales bacterium]
MSSLYSLRSRIFFACAALAVLSIGVAVYVVSIRVTAEAERSLQRELVTTVDLVEQLRTTRAQTFTLMARLFADGPRLKAAVDTNDPPTVQDIANEYQEQLQSNLLLVTNAGGEVLATVGTTAQAADVIASQPSVRDAVAGREGVSLLPWPGGVLQLVTVPISLGLTEPDILGTLSVGFLLGADLAAQLKEITGSEIAFGINGQVLATTLPSADHAALASLLSGDGASRTLRLHDEDYVVLPLPLSAEAAVAGETKRPVALILRSRTEHLRFLQSLRTELAVTALLAVLMATLLAFAVARTITRPLAAITDVMRQVADTGDLTRKIVLRSSSRWHDEDAQLLATTFNTLTDSVARFQREMSQRERLSSLGQLSTVIAHEVRNPLMIIKAALHTLRQPDVSSATIREAARDIDDEVVRLNRIVNEVLDFSKPVRFDLEATDLNALCQEAAQAAQATPGAGVDLDFDATVPAITVDSERLRLALVNLIVNARHAVASDLALPAAVGDRDPAERRLGRVCLSTRATAHTVTIAVSDNGVGIAPADLPRIFDPYFTTKRGGTGLGLPIARNIVEGLGGSISATSAAGRGTEIRVELPRASRAPGVRIS